MADTVTKLRGVPGTTPNRREFREIPHIVSMSDWDNIARVKGALSQLEMGYFMQAAALVDSMGRDDRIEGVTGQRFQGYLGLPLRIEDPESGSKRKKTAIMKVVERNFSTMFSEDALFDLMKWGHMVGAGVGELVWNTDADAGMWMPKLKVWHPRYLRWDWEKEAFLITTRDQGDLTVTPGDGKWVLYTPYGTKGWMRGMVRSLSVPWIFRQWSYRDWMRYSELYGSPSRLGHMPVSASPESKDQFLEQLAALGRDVAIKLETDNVAGQEQGFDVTLLEATGTGWDGFDRALSKCEASIAIRVCGQNLTTEVKAGSFAAASVHENVRHEILKFDDQTVSNCLREQVLQPFALFNFGKASLAPWARRNVDPPEDKKAKGESMKLTGEAISALQATGAKPDVDLILEECGIPVSAPAGEPPAPEPTGPTAKVNRLAKATQTGFIRGQVFADQLADTSRAQGAAALRGHLAKLVELIETADSFEGLRAALIAHYEDSTDPTELQTLIEKVTILAQLSGRWGALEDI